MTCQLVDIKCTENQQLILLGEKKAPKWNPAVEQANKIMASEGESEWLHCHWTWTVSRMFLVTLSPSLSLSRGRPDDHPFRK